MSSSEGHDLRARARQVAASLTILLTGVCVVQTHARWVAYDWPMVLGGLVISAGAIVCLRKRPPLAAVIATQGMLFAVLFSQAFVVGFRTMAFGIQSIGQALVAALLSFTGLALGLPLLAPGRTESTFAPLRYRKVLLLGAIACAASSAIELTGAQYFLQSGIIERRFDWMTQGCALGLMGIVQAAAVIGLLRMRGIALLGGLAASAVGAIWTATTGHLTLIPHIGCAVLATIAWAIPLLPRPSGAEEDATTGERVRVSQEHDDAALELDSNDVSASPPLHASR